jgi:hypothetical protein
MAVIRRIAAARLIIDAHTHAMHTMSSWTTSRGTLNALIAVRKQPYST